MSRFMLRTAVVCLSILAGMANAAIAQDDGDWSHFESKGHQFEASFPAKQVETMETEIVTHYYCAISGTDTDFRVGVSSVAGDPATKEELLAELKRIRDEVVQSLDAKLGESKEIESNGRQGLHFELTTEFEGQELVMTCRYFIVHKRLYQIMVVRSAGEDLKSQQTRFFDSFKIRD